MRLKKAVLNLFSGITLQLITALAGFILPVLLIHTYGSTLYGLVASIRQFLSYLTLVEAGIGAASIAALYIPLANNDKDKINGILSGTRIFYNKSGWAFIALVFLLSIIYPFIVKSQVNSLLSFALVLVLGISGSLEFFFIGKYQVLLVATQKNYVITFIQCLGIIFNLLATFLLIKLGLNLLAVQIGSAIIYLLRALIIYSYVKRNYSYISFYTRPDNLALKQRWHSFVHQIAGMVVFNTNIVVLTIFSKLNEVSVYSIYLMIFNAVAMILSSVSIGLSAAFGDILAKGEIEILNSRYMILEFIYYALLAFTYTCTLILIIPFMTVYTKGMTDANYIRPLVAAIFVLSEILNKIRIPSNIMVTAAGHFQETRNRAIVEAVINITVSILLAPKFGIVGVLVGTVCSYLYRTTDFIIYTSKNILYRSPYITYKNLLYNIMAAIIALLPFQFIHIQVTNFVQWIGYAVITSLWVAVIVCAVNFILNQKNAKASINYIKQIGPLLLPTHNVQK